MILESVIGGLKMGIGTYINIESISMFADKAADISPLNYIICFAGIFLTADGATLIATDKSLTSRISENLKSFYKYHIRRAEA